MRGLTRQKRIEFGCVCFDDRRFEEGRDRKFNTRLRV